MTRDGVRVLASVELRNQNLQTRFEFINREHDRQFIEDVGRALTVLTHCL